MEYYNWSSPIARAIIRSARMRDPRKAVVRDAAALLAEVGIEKPPVDLRVVGSYQGVREIQRVRMPYAGRLIPSGRGYIIQTNAGDTRARQNFSIAHEIGHTLLHRYRPAGEKLTVEDRTIGSYRRREEVEYLCDQAAAELLLPTALFRPLAAGLGCSLDTIDELARQFVSSYEATAIQLVSMNLWPCAFVVWHRVLRPHFSAFSSRSPGREIAMKYAVRSSSFGYPLSASLAVRADGYIANCFRLGRDLSGEERFKCGEEEVTFFAMAMAAGRDHKTRQVFSLLVPLGGVAHS